MTTRFSIAEVADMLHAPLEAVRAAVDELSELGELTAESFAFGDRNWRVAPSDVKRIQAKVQVQGQRESAKGANQERRIVRKKRMAPTE